ncbi:hypothetical protein E1263_12980 [Kribbella antibiotica]|uniref:Uncharacterized protein n=1 Tax=Kribbella antibiotica TaxID=190195 RepID=A0A4R4ZSN2_9ACTN|nr:hypothetical protein E1263_12980 [Kribbella antibiotica]
MEPNWHWLAGYAPGSGSRLVGQLKAQGFDLETVRGAGLGLEESDGRVVDRFRDQLVLPARDESAGRHRLCRSSSGQRRRVLRDIAGHPDPPPVPNPGWDCGATGSAAARRDARAGWNPAPGPPALPPAGARARRTCQLREGTPADRERSPRRRSAGRAHRVFNRVRAIELLRGQPPASLWMRPGGQQQLYDRLVRSRPLTDYSPVCGRRRSRSIATGPSDAPGLSQGVRLTEAK